MPVQSPDLFSLRNLSKTFDDKIEALRNVSLNIKRGSFTAIVGPSGCGKSTLLRMLSGLAKPTTGTIEHEQNATHSSLPLGFVFQEPTLMPWSKVTRNVSLPLEILGQSADEYGPRVDKVLKQVGLDGFENAFPRELSGGMKMRVSLARALLPNPSALLLDEPFAALDEITRTKLNDDLLNIWQADGLTIVFVTHSVYEAAYLAERAIVMSPRPGRVVADLSFDPPLPRDDAYRVTPQYGETCGAISLALRKSMDEQRV